MLGPNDLPFAVVGERCLIKVHEPKTRSAGGIEIPAMAQNRPFTGRLIDAGLRARDKLHDNGIRIGDDILFGKFAGVVEEWEHIIEGDPSSCSVDDDWTRLPSKPGQPEKWKLDKDPTVIRAAEPVVVLNCDDILASVQLAARIGLGDVEVVRGAVGHPGGPTQHVLRPAPDAFELAESAHRRAMAAINDNTTSTLANGAA